MKVLGVQLSLSHAYTVSFAQLHCLTLQQLHLCSNAATQAISCAR